MTGTNNAIHGPKEICEDRNESERNERKESLAKFAKVNKHNGTGLLCRSLSVILFLFFLPSIWFKARVRVGRKK